MPTVSPAIPAPPISASTTACVEWLGLRVVAPSHWEIVRHSPSPRKGSLVFADRRRQRLQVTWTACTRRPDVARLLADHREKQRELDPDVVITTPLLPAGWRGMRRVQNEGGLLTRAARFDAKSSRLIEIVYDGDPDPLDELLMGLRVTGPAEVARRIRAFHLDLTIPEGFQLTATHVQPADTALTFSTQRDTREPDKFPTLRVRRRAMADAWFDGDLRRLLKAHAPRARMDFIDDPAVALLPSREAGGRATVHAGGPGPTSQPPHPATIASWNVPGPRYRRLLNLHRVARACAWHCPVEQAIYDVVITAPAKSPPTFEGLALLCGQGGCDG